MNAEEFLKQMHHLDEIFKLSDDAEYNERQLLQFAERYYKAKSNNKNKYKRCSALNIPDVNTRLFYKIGHRIKDENMAECTFVEIIDENKLKVYFKNPQSTMIDKISHFFTLNE